MYKKKNKKYIILIFFIIFIIVLIILDQVLNINKININNGFLKDVSTYINKTINMPIKLVKNNKEKINTETELEVQNKELRKEINELKKALEIKNVLSEYKKINSITINRNLGYWYRNITIDKGKKDEIGKNMAVINSDGLIGIVDKTSNHTSTIKLLTSNRLNKISVKIEIKGKYVYALLTGYDEKDNTFILEGISENVDIPLDSLVTTTGMGSIFPAGILVGTVKSIDTDNYDLAKIVKIKSNVDFNDINIVTVLKRGSE